MLDEGLVALATVFYAGVVAVTLRRRTRPWSRTLLWLATATAGTLVALRWSRTGSGPFLTLYDILVSNLFTLGLVSSIAAHHARLQATTFAVCAGVGALLGLWALVVPDAPSTLPASYESPWLWVHVLTGKIFLGCLLVAAGEAVTTLRGTQDANVDETMWRFVMIGFVFETGMLVTGAIWAQDAWGRYWAWDPVETWALLTWLAVAIGLHARLAMRVPPRAGAVVVLTCFTLAFLTLFGVPFLSAGPHAGAF